MLLRNTMFSLRKVRVSTFTNARFCTQTTDNFSALKNINENLKDIISKKNQLVDQILLDEVQASLNSQEFKDQSAGKTQEEIENTVDEMYKAAFDETFYIDEEGKYQLYEYDDDEVVEEVVEEDAEEDVDNTVSFSGKHDALIDSYADKIENASSEEEKLKLTNEFLETIFPPIAAPAPKQEKQVKKDTKPFDIKSIDVQELKSAPKFKPSSDRDENEDLQLIKSKFDFNSVPVRYAHLLYSTFKKNGILGKLDDEVEKLKYEYENSKVFRNLVDNTLLSQNDRDGKLVKYLDDSDLDPLMQGFLYAVSTHGRLSSITNIMNTLALMRYQVEKDNQILHIVSAEKLTNKQRDEIQQLIQNKFNPSGNLVLNEMVDPSLGGGYELYYADTFHLDNSQRTISQELSQKIESTVSSYFTEKDKERQESFETAMAEAQANEQEELNREEEEELEGEEYVEETEAEVESKEENKQ